MKLSNFEWTDKETVKWFILLPSGHEGPYSLKVLKSRFDSKSLSGDSKIWSEGLNEGTTLKNALYQFEAGQSEKIKVAEVKREIVSPPAVPPAPIVPKKVEVVEEPPEELPPLPIIETKSPELAPVDEIPPLPPLPEIEEPKRIEKGPRSTWKVLAGILGLVFFLFYLGFYQWIRGQEKFSISRKPKMGLDLYERINKEIAFDGWDKKIFFKEYVATDFSSIWLVTSGYQHCEVEATFHSIKGKTLSMNEDEVVFKSQATLSGHIAEFDNFNFTTGQKIIPGLYEVDIEAKNCEWDGPTAKIANKFKAPDSTYQARVKMILFPSGPVEFNSILDKLLKKKSDLALKIQNKDEQFWQTIIEKMQTLSAITYQVEQFFLDVLAQDARKYDQNIKNGVSRYTKQFGSVLTNFVISNEKDFDKISQADIERVADGEDYEKVVRLTSKSIGFESMKLIEYLQTLKKPRRARLNEEKKKISKTYSKLREKINSELTQIQKKQAQ